MYFRIGIMPIPLYNRMAIPLEKLWNDHFLNEGMNL